jgi:hypothetical protein
MPVDHVGVVHGGPTTMASTELHRSSTMGRHRRGVPMERGGRGEDGKAHWWRVLVAGLVNQAGSEVGWWRCLELAVPMLGAQRKENGWGTAAVRTREGEGSFYRPGTAEGRRSDEVNAGGGGGVLMALQTLVSGWERRGAVPVAGGEVEEAPWCLGSHVPEVARGGAWRREAGRRRWLLLAQGGRRPAGTVLGDKAGLAVFFAGLAQQGEVGEMGGLHRGLGPKLKRNRN